MTARIGGILAPYVALTVSLRSRLVRRLAPLRAIYPFDYAPALTSNTSVFYNEHLEPLRKR